MPSSNRISADEAVEGCAAFGATPAPAVEILPVTSDIPTLLISGGTDFQTPERWADRVAETLDDAQHYVFPVASHVASQSDACARDLALAFFAAPDEAIDTGCLADDPSSLILESEDLAATFSP